MDNKTVVLPNKSHLTQRTVVEPSPVAFQSPCLKHTHLSPATAADWSFLHLMNQPPQPKELINYINNGEPILETYKLSLPELGKFTTYLNQPDTFKYKHIWQVAKIRTMLRNNQLTTKPLTIILLHISRAVRVFKKKKKKHNWITDFDCAVSIKNIVSGVHYVWYSLPHHIEPNITTN